MKKKYWRLVGRSACLAGLAVVNGRNRQRVFILLVWLFQFFGFDHSVHAQVYYMLVQHAYYASSGLLGERNTQIVEFGAPVTEMGIGQFSLTFPSSPAPPPGYTSPSFISYCMELDVSIGVADGGSYYNMYPKPFGATDGAQPWASDGPEKAAYLYNNFSHLSSNQDAAALQTAIWSVLYGKNSDANIYDYKVHPTVANDFYANWQYFIKDGVDHNWLLNGQTFTSTEWDGVNLVQGLIGPPIPEPAATGAAVTAVLGLISIYEVRQRRTRLTQKPLRS